MRVGRVAVGGHSMSPALEHGDHVLYVSGRARAGDVVVAHDPRDAGRWIVKRVERAAGDEVHLRSDREGHERLTVRRDAIVGRAVLRYRPLSRVGVI